MCSGSWGLFRRCIDPNLIQNQILCAREVLYTGMRELALTVQGEDIGISRASSRLAAECRRRVIAVRENGWLICA